MAGNHLGPFRHAFLLHHLQSTINPFLSDSPSQESSGDMLKCSVRTQILNLVVTEYTQRFRLLYSSTHLSSEGTCDLSLHFPYSIFWAISWQHEMPYQKSFASVGFPADFILVISDPLNTSKNVRGIHVCPPEACSGADR